MHAKITRNTGDHSHELLFLQSVHVSAVSSPRFFLSNIKIFMSLVINQSPIIILLELLSQSDQDEPMWTADAYGLVCILIHEAHSLQTKHSYIYSYAVSRMFLQAVHG